MTRVAAPVVLISARHAHRRIELYVFSDDRDGSLHLLSLSGGQGRLPAVEKGQGPLPDRDSALFVRDAIVAELLRADYLQVPADQAVWEVYARGRHRQTLRDRQDLPVQD